MGNGLGDRLGKGLGQATILIGTVLQVTLIGAAHYVARGVFRTCSALVVCSGLVGETTAWMDS
jgi:hypothetical protein